MLHATQSVLDDFVMQSKVVFISSEIHISISITLCICRHFTRSSNCNKSTKRCTDKISVYKGVQSMLT